MQENRTNDMNSMMKILVRERKRIAGGMASGLKVRPCPGSLQGKAGAGQNWFKSCLEVYGTTN